MTPKKLPNYREQGRRLSPVLSKIILQAEEDNRQILTRKDFVDFYDISDGYARKMIAQLVETGWLVRLGAGKYQLQPAKTGLDPYPSADKFVAAGQLSPDCFIAFGSAAEYHGLTMQVFQSVIMVTTKRGRIWEGPPIRILYVHASEANFVGFENISRGPNIRVATIERTLIDAVNRPELCGGISDIPEIFRRARSRRAKVEKVLEYLPTYGSKSLTQRMGFMLECSGFWLTPEQEHQLQTLTDGNYAYLFTPNRLGTTPHHTYNSKWRLVINADGFVRDPVENAPEYKPKISGPCGHCGEMDSVKQAEAGQEWKCVRCDGTTDLLPSEAHRGKHGPSRTGNDAIGQCCNRIR